ASFFQHLPKLILIVTFPGEGHWRSDSARHGGNLALRFQRFAARQ
ncbi:hypothetical protein MEA186_28147, partial [Mesorhizobium amorphae CCNWGS0123]